MAKKIALVAGPVLGQDSRGRPRWTWKVERTVGDVKQEIQAANRPEATRIFREAILQGISEGFSVFARYVEQTGAGEEAEYQSDGTVSFRRMISAREGILGPRCFVVPMTPIEKAKRTAALRPPKKDAPPPKPPKPAKPPKEAKPPKPPKEPKPAKPPKPPKPEAGPKMAPAVVEYLSAPNKVAWVAAAPGVKLAHIAKYMKAHGTAAQQQEFQAARTAREEGKPVKPPSRPPRPAAPAVPTTIATPEEALIYEVPPTVMAPVAPPAPPAPAAPAAPAVDPAVMAMLQNIATGLMNLPT